MLANTWQSVLTKSAANSGQYDEGELPHVNWAWPKRTWFQVRREFVRERRPIRIGNDEKSLERSGQIGV